MPPATSDIVEVEWQFDAVDTARVARWLQMAAVPGYTVAPGKTKDLDDTYFDTADWRVHRAGLTCRVRRKIDAAELTLKGMAESQDSMRSRRELTEELDPAAATSPIAAPGPCGHALRLIAGKRPLEPIFQIQTRRQTFILSDGLGVLAEIAVDDTSVPSGEAVAARLARIEVEVDGAAVERARRFVDVLVAAAVLVPAKMSKFETALAATGQKIASPATEVGPTSIDDSMTAGEVAFAIMRKQFAVFIANEPGTRLGEDIEALHDMRVAARRMRAAMGLLAPFVSPRLASIRAQFGWVAAALGEVRDLDVQIERMAEWREGFSEAQAHALDSVEALLIARRNEARKRMLLVLNSRRYDYLVLRFATFLRRGPAKSFAPGRQSILAVAPDVVERRYRRVRKAGDRIASPSPAADYHLLRIDAKKLRYALEFVGPIYGKSATDFSQRVTALQDVLGLHQDADVAMKMLHQMAATSGRRLGPAALLVMGAIAERYRVHAIELRKQFPKVYKPLAGAEWKRLLKLMEGRRS